MSILISGKKACSFLYPVAPVTVVSRIDPEILEKEGATPTGPLPVSHLLIHVFFFFFLSVVVRVCVWGSEYLGGIP